MPTFILNIFVAFNGRFDSFIGSFIVFFFFFWWCWSSICVCIKTNISPVETGHCNRKNGPGLNGETKESWHINHVPVMKHAGSRSLGKGQHTEALITASAPHPPL